MSEILLENVVVQEDRIRDNTKSQKKKDKTTIVPATKTKDTKEELTPIPLQHLVPIYLNQILPQETHDYPLVSYERPYGPGYLYVLYETNHFQEQGSFYKIGVTNDLKRRLRDIQNGNPRPLVPECLIKVNNMEKVGTALEETLGKYKVVVHGGKDWYRAESEEDVKVVVDVITGIRRRMKGVEIPVEQFKDYVNYYINFDEDV